MKDHSIKFTILATAILIFFAADASAQMLKPGEIVYGRTQSDTNGSCGTAAIWAVGPDGLNDRFITFGRHPRISPDGRKILFKRWQNVSCSSGFEGGFGWFVRELATGVETQIGGQNGGSNGAFFTPETNRASLQIVAAAAGQMCNLNTNGTAGFCYGAQIPLQGFGHPTVRGGDFQIVAENYDDFPVDVGGLYTLNYDRTNILKIPNTTFIDLSPSWSNDGQTIAYAQYVTTCCRSAPYFFLNLFKIKPDGTNKTQLTNVTNLPPGSGFTYSLVWSPDNSVIYNAARLNGVTGIYKIDAAGGGILGRLPVTPGQPVESVGGIMPPYEEKEIAAWGGGVATDGSLTLVNSIGQAFAGQTSTGGSFNLQSGFWTIDSFTKSPFDFDGDGKTDISIFRPGAGEWWLNQSSTGQTTAAQFGSASDQPVPADFTGDGKTDIGFFRPVTGEWFILRSENASFFSFPFGTSGDVPFASDFDGDGKADPGVFRPSNLTWFISKSSGGTIITTFGALGDVPVTVDYDGDGKADIAIYRPSTGQWWISRSSNNSVYAFQFGLSTDKAVPGDYTGDGKADAAFFRPSTGEWFISRSEDGSFYSLPFGTSGDLPVPGDYDGDGRFDIAVFRPGGATWFVNRSTAGILIANFGIGGDLPLPNVFVR